MKKPKKKSEKYLITISDWIIFLENESTITYNLLVLFASIVIIAIIAVFQVADDILASIFGVIFLFLFFCILLIK